MYLFSFSSTYSSMRVQSCPTFMQFSTLSLSLPCCIRIYVHRPPLAINNHVVGQLQFVCACLVSTITVMTDKKIERCTENQILSYSVCALVYCLSKLISVWCCFMCILTDTQFTNIILCLYMHTNSHINAIHQVPICTSLPVILHFHHSPLLPHLAYTHSSCTTQLYTVPQYETRFPVHEPFSRHCMQRHHTHTGGGSQANRTSDHWWESVPGLQFHVKGGLRKDDRLPCHRLADPADYVTVAWGGLCS